MKKDRGPKKKDLVEGGMALSGSPKKGLRARPRGKYQRTISSHTSVRPLDSLAAMSRSRTRGVSRSDLAEEECSRSDRRIYSYAMASCVVVSSASSASSIMWPAKHSIFGAADETRDGRRRRTLFIYSGFQAFLGSPIRRPQYRG